MTNQAQKLYDNAFQAKRDYRRGIIDRNKAKDIIEPYIDFVNQKSIEIAKKYNLKPKFVNFITFTR